MKTLTKFKIQQSALKAYIFLTGFIFAIYCGMLCFGVRHSIAEWIGMTLAYILLCIAAWTFKLCPLSWAFIIYTYAIRCCIIVHRHGWFGEYINIAHSIAFAIGIILCSIFLFNIKQYINTNYETKSEDDGKDAA